MMMNTKKEIKQNSSIHQRIRRASFVPVEPEQTKMFKYLLNFFRLSKSKEKITSFKRKFNSVIQNIGLWVNKVDWAKSRKDVSIWAIEVFIEGITLNFATHYLMGFNFSIPMIVAHGILVKQGLSIIWRLKQNGSNSTISYKHK